MIRSSILFILIVSLGAGLTAQGPTDELAELQERWAACITTDTCGSTDELHQQLIEAYREADDLENFTWHFWERQSAETTNKVQALAWLDAAKTGRWRSATTEREWGAICYEEINRAYLLIGLGDILGSIRAFEQAERIYLEYSFEYVDPLEQIYKPLMNNYTRLGDNRNALLIAEQALNQIVPRQQVTAAAGFYNNAGIATWNGGNYTQADSLFELGLQLPDLPPLQASQLLFSQARNQLDQGQLELAERTLSYSEKQFDKIPEEDIDSGHKELITVQLILRARLTVNDERAMALYEMALAQIKENKGSLDYQREAGKVFNQMAKIAARSGLNDAKENSASYYNQALRCLLPTYPTDQPFAPPPTDSLLYAENTLLEALDGKATLLGSANALAHYEAAQQVAFLLHATYQNEQERLNAQAANRARTEAAMALCLELANASNSPQEKARYELDALRWMEQNRAILLSEARRESAGGSGDLLLDSLLQQRLELRQNLNHLETTGAATALRADKRRELADLQARIEELSPVAGYMGPELDLASLARLRTENGRLILSYFVGQESAYCFYARGTDQGLISLPYNSLTHERLSRFSRLLADRQALIEAPELYPELGEQVRQDWLPEVLPWYTATQLILLTDAALHQLPFAALPTSNANQPLLRQLSIRHIYSLQIEGLRSAGDEAVQTESRFFFAPFTKRGRDQWAALPHSQEELNCENGYCLTDSAATLASLQAALHTSLGQPADYSIFHLSTHAQARGSQVQIECFDGALSLSEIARLRIPADLVILSACETNVGRYQAGEGVYSLARNFTYAGAQSLVASSWAVSDRSTAWIMQHFHQQLEAGMDRAEALRTAQLHYLDREDLSAVERLPFYWAGFSLTGQDGPVFSTPAGLSSLSDVFNLSLGLVLLLIILGGFWWWRRKY